MHVFILCGLAFAGKTTVARIIADETGADLISLDGLNEARGLRGGDGIADVEWARSHELALERLDAALRSRRSAVVDDTNCFRFLRDGYRKIAAAFSCGATVLLLDADVATVRERIEENRRTSSRDSIAAGVLEDLVQKFEWPDETESVLLVPRDADVRSWFRARVTEGRFE